MVEIYDKHPERIWEINSALSDACELEVNNITNGKVNYDTVLVDSLVKKMCKLKSTPLEKLQIFWEIHTHINTSIAKGGRKQSEDLKKRKIRSNEIETLNANFQQFKADQIKKWAPIEETDRDNTTMEDTIWSGDIFTASEIDAWSEWSKQVGENA